MGTVHHDLIQQIKANFPRLQIPNPGVNDFCNTWAHLFGMNADTQWFSELSAMMAGYCQFYPSCGTLADCAVEGPAVGQFIANTQLSTEPPPRATHFGQTTATRQFDTRLSTTPRSIQEWPPVICISDNKEAKLIAMDHFGKSVPSTLPVPPIVTGFRFLISSAHPFVLVPTTRTNFYVHIPAVLSNFNSYLSFLYLYCILYLYILII